MINPGVTETQLGKAGVDNEALMLLRRAGAAIRLSTCARILCQGENADRAFLLEEGLVVLTVSDGDGRHCCLGYRRPGSILGSVSILSAGRYPATVIAQTEIRVIAISADSLLKLVDEERAVSSYLHRMHAKEHYDWISRASAEATLNARERIEEFLWEWMGHIPNPTGRFRLPFSDNEFARFISVSPQHLSGLFQQLEEMKLLRRSHGVITVTERSKLFHREL